MRRGGTAFSCAPGPHRRGELIETASGDFRRRSPQVRQHTSDRGELACVRQQLVGG